MSLTCSACRNDLLLERRIYEGMAAEPGVEYMPAASLKRLLAVHRRARRRSSSTRGLIARLRGSMPWRGMAAAGIVVAAVIAAFLAADRWPAPGDRGPPPIYHTVTSPRPHAPDEVIRAVFSPSLTLVDLQGILDESQLKIISGPTEAGVYSLAATSSRPVSVSLAIVAPALGGPFCGEHSRGRYRSTPSRVSMRPMGASGVHGRADGCMRQCAGAH